MIQSNIDLVYFFISLYITIECIPMLNKIFWI